jgi:rRNA processing protein Gar1
VTPTGNLTVRAVGSDVVSEGTPVRDARGILRGRVVRVFGPVARPYLSVRPRRVPTPEEGLALLGSNLVRE